MIQIKSINRRQFLKTAIAAGLTILPSGVLSGRNSSMSTAEKPNILFILTDDQGWPTLGCYGNKRVPTPNFDRLAAEGMQFSDAYVMPQCTPTRAALLTGQHTARNRMWHVIRGYYYPWARMAEPLFVENLPRETFTIAKGLKTAGYATAILGKWHLTNNQDGNYIGLKPEGATHYGFDFSPKPPEPNYQAKGDKGVNWLTEQALAFARRNRDRPWFCYLAHHTIHGPVLAPPELVAKYRKHGAPETGLYNAVYLAALEHLDASIGRLMRGLEELGQRERTLIVFLSDNGGIYQISDPKPFLEGAENPARPPYRLNVLREEFSNAPLRAGKGSHYEGGIRVPCIVSWPGVVKPGSVNKTPVHVVDWMPTLLEAAGVQAPLNHHLDGVSLVPLLRGAELPARSLFWYLPLYEVRFNTTPCAIIREGDYKLIEFFGDWFDPEGNYVLGHRIELYDLRKDIGEKHNLAESQPTKAAEMLRRLHDWIHSIPAEVPMANPNFNPDRALTETRTRPPSG